MAASPHLSPKLVVGVGSLLLALAATLVTVRLPGFPGHVPLRAWPAALLRRLRRELPRGGRIALAAWSVLVSVLHFGGIRYGIYTRVAWWDLLTHTMGGLGVAALLGMTFRDAALRSPAWLPAGVLAIGAGFEVYEFAFKTFWYRWSLSFYVVDTVVDLCVNTVGAAVAAVGVALCRRRCGWSVDTNPEPSDDLTGEGGSESVAADAETK